MASLEASSLGARRGHGILASGLSDQRGIPPPTRMPGSLPFPTPLRRHFRRTQTHS
jgi:hypothetical protein